MSIFERPFLKIPLLTLSLTIASPHAGQASGQEPLAVAAPGATIAASFHAATSARRISADYGFLRRRH